MCDLGQPGHTVGIDGAEAVSVSTRGAPDGEQGRFERGQTRHRIPIESARQGQEQAGGAGSLRE